MKLKMFIQSKFTTDRQIDIVTLKVVTYAYTFSKRFSKKGYVHYIQESTNALNWCLHMAKLKENIHYESGIWSLSIKRNKEIEVTLLDHND